MRRAPRPAVAAAAGLAVAMVIGLGVLAWRAAGNEELDAVRPGVAATQSIADLTPRRELCQRPLDLDRPAPRIGLAVSNGAAPGPEIRVRISDVNRRRVLSRASIPAGWALAPGQYFTLTLPRPLPADTEIEVCARNVGKTTIQLYGNDAIADSALREGDDIYPADWAIFFPLLPEERRSYLQMIPDFLSRASVVRPGVVSLATYTVLGLLLLVGGPLLLWRAVTRAAVDDAQD